MAQLGPCRSMLGCCLCVLVADGPLNGQQEIWRYWPHNEFQAPMGSMRDIDGDGNRELLILAVTDPYGLGTQARVRMLSGASGAVLYDRVHSFSFQPLKSIVGVGDVDGDGFDDYSLIINPNNPCCQSRLEIWSPRLSQMLWVALGPLPVSIDTYGFYTCAANLDGDSNMEILTSTHDVADSRVFAYDHDGSPLYTLNLLSFGEQVRGLGNVGDVTGDGRDDIGVGLIESTGRGGVRLFNGATGASLRVDLGEQYGDALGWKVVPFGDYDLDGVPDYACSNRFGYPRGVICIFSGATGARLRQWIGGSNLAESLLAGFDMDLDGVGDVFAGGPHYYNGEVSPGAWWFGRVQAFSGRDGGLLWDEQNWPSTVPGVVTSSDISLGLVNTMIGPIGRDPYPVIIVYDRPAQIVGGFAYYSDRLRAIRVSPAGTGVVGAGCSSSGAVPKIAVRRDAVTGTRVTLSGAAAGVPAWLLIGTAGQSAWQGNALPMPLDLFGLLGCDLRVPPTILWGNVTGTVGQDRGHAFVHAPYALALTGLAVATQWLTLDPATLGYAMTARHELHLQ